MVIPMASETTNTHVLFAAIFALIIAVSFAVLEPKAAVIGCLLGGIMLAIAISDAQRLIVPDILSLPAIPAGLLLNPLLSVSQPMHVTALAHLAAAVLALGLFLCIRYAYKAWRGREGLGLGDVKLAAAAGAWTGLDGLSWVILLAAVLALFFSFFSAAGEAGRLRATMAVPFGAFLAPSIWLIWSALQTGLILEF